MLLFIALELVDLPRVARVLAIVVGLCTAFPVLAVLLVTPQLPKIPRAFLAHRASGLAPELQLVIDLGE